jgi:hypothetical protein
MFWLTLIIHRKLAQEMEKYCWLSTTYHIYAKKADIKKINIAINHPMKHVGWDNIVGIATRYLVDTNDQ